MQPSLEAIDDRCRAGQALTVAARVTVMKFGGTSVQDAAAIRRVAAIVRSRLDLHPVVVVSALAKVTDQLVAMGQAATQGRLEESLSSLAAIRSRHAEVASELVKLEASADLWADLEVEFSALGGLLRSIATARELSPERSDHLLSFGECISSKVITAALASDGLDVVCVDARKCIITDDSHTSASPLFRETNERLLATLTPILQSGRVPVLGGFIASTRQGVPSTLGRGGSDLSASIVGAGLGARRIEIWTDVDGIMTTDPNLCPEARSVDSLSFDEAAELAYFGAKVLHPATLAPAIRENIPVSVLNSRNPLAAGTRIVPEVSQQEGRVKAITTKRTIAVVDVTTDHWVSPDLLRSIIDTFHRHKCHLSLISAARNSVSLLVGSTEALPAISRDIGPAADVKWANHKALICLVGENIRRRPEIAEKVFKTIADFDVRMICCGASERNISFLIDESHAVESVHRLHGAFFGIQGEKSI